LAHTLDITDAAPGRPTTDVRAIHAAFAGFVWATLLRFGVRAADGEDMLQEVFVVVHTRLHTVDPAASLKSWLYGICLRVAAAYRRRAHIQRERSLDAMPDEIAPRAAGPSPEDAAAAGEARAQLDAVLDALDLEKRAVFVMFELDGLPCSEIAAIVGVPVGTVHSRLYAARHDFEAAVARFRARQRRTQQEAP
jgi:RNA polymerase sigma-70 factor (ECF subfamily)